MSIDKYQTAKGVRYRVRMTLPGGKRTDKRGFTSKREARLYLADFQVQRSRGTFVPEGAGRVLMSELVRQTLESDIHRAPMTRATREVHARKWVVPYWGSWSVGDITTLDVRDWVRSMIADGATRDTIMKAHQLLKSVLDAAIEMRCIIVNPMPALQLPKEQKKLHPYLTHDEVRELVDEMPAHYRELVAVLAYTGIRFGEAAALEARSVDLARQRLHVVRSVSEPNGKLSYGPPKNGKKRTVPLPKTLITMLERRLATVAPDGHVFTTSGGSVIRLSTWRPREFKPDIRKLNVRRQHEGRPPFPDITPHDLRHTAASLAVQAGANVKVIQRMLGHASAAITLDVYADLFDSDLDDVASRLDSLIRLED
jgi:integrase